MPTDQIWDLALRLGLAVVIGAVIGVNRYLHGQAAGLRTHALVALGAALAVQVAIMLPGVNAADAASAASRVMQGIITGVGFLGAGVILHGARDGQVHGLTTAAAIWTTAVFGALCGTGRIGVALVGFAIVLLVLSVGGPIERAIHARFGTKDKERDRGGKI